MKDEEAVDIDPITGEPMIYDEFPEFDAEAEAEFLARQRRRKAGEHPAEAEAETDEEPAVKTSEELEAECGELLRHPRILNVVDEVLTGSGFAGPTWTVLLIVLALYSRHLSHPISVVVRGESASGKSHAIKRGLDFVSRSAYYALTSMSGKALYYDDADLSHKIVVIYEADGLKDDTAAHAMRTLLSEGCLEYKYTDFETKSVVSIRREGPTGLLTSTAGPLDYELGTRAFSISIDDGQEMTEAIMLAEAKLTAGASRAPDTEAFVALDQLLALNRKPVVVPFAETVAKETDATAVRMRRDFSSVLRMVQAHALMHQFSREKDSHGRIIAQIDDYETVFHLVADLVSHLSGEALPPEIRETVEFIRDSASLGGPLTVTRIADALGVHRTTASRRLKRAMAMDLVIPVSSGIGQPKSYLYGGFLPEDRSVLPHPDQIREAGA